MKNALRFVFVALGFLIVTHVNGQISVGPGVVYGTEIDNIGISVNGKYDFTEAWSVAPSFTYFLEKDMVNWSALDIDGNYQFFDIENVGGLYALAGLNMTFWKIDVPFWGKMSGNELGVNLGVGLNIALGAKMELAPEIRYTLGDADYLRIGVKLLFGI